MSEPSLGELLRALHFAADRHRDQRRKDRESSPYINHPIEVAEVLCRIAGVDDVQLLQAALLHDTIEDTETTGAELEAEFGATVRRWVDEVTDDGQLPKEERKRLQIERSRQLSAGGRQLRIADKICNVGDVTDKPPARWSLRRRRDYLEWTRAVVEGCRGVNEALEREFDRRLRRGLSELEPSGESDERS